MTGPNLARMAWRNLWRNTRRTLITLAGLAFGVMLALIFTGMADFTYTRMINLAARTGGGHVTYQHREALDTPSLKKTVTGVEALRERALSDPEVERVATRAGGAVMLATATKSYGAGFIAIDPDQEDPRTLALLDSIREGEMFESSRNDGILLGSTLANNLKATPGKKVVYTMTDRHGDIVSGLARVRGIVHTGSPSADGVLCLLPLDTVRDLLDYGADEAGQVAVFIRDQRRAAAVARRLDADTTGTTGAFTWKEVQPDLAGFITMDGSAMIFFEVIIMILVAAGIFNSLFVSVMERMREFGIMVAVGFSPGHLFRLVVWESTWLALVGIAMAGVVTIGPYMYLNRVGIDLSSMLGGETYEVSGVALEPILRVDIYPEKIFIIGALVIVATILAGLYPAWRATRVVPVESIKLV